MNIPASIKILLQAHKADDGSTLAMLDIASAAIQVAECAKQEHALRVAARDEKMRQLLASHSSGDDLAITANKALNPLFEQILRPLRPSQQD